MRLDLLLKNKFYLTFILFVIGFIVYAPTLSHNFVWDDHLLIDGNPLMKDPASILSFFTKDIWANTELAFQSGFYRPLTLLSFFVNYHLWQGSPAGFHLFNVLLHCCNGMLIFHIFFSLTEKKLGPFIAALLFLVHPLQTETVAFISDAGDLLCVFFLLLCCWEYCLFTKNNRNRTHYCFSLIFLCAALLSKENALIGFFLVMLLDFFFLSQCDLRKFLKKCKVLAPFLLITAVYVMMRGIILGFENAVTTLGNVRYVSLLPSFDFWSHVLTVIKILGVYLEMFFWPTHQTISYVILPAVSIFAMDVLLPACILSILLFLIIISFRSNYSWIAFSLIWFFVTIVPLSNLIPISNTIAERFMYLPSVGLCLFVGYNCDWLWAQKHKMGFSAILPALIFLLILSLSLKTVQYSHKWKSDYSLFSQVKNKTYPCAPVAYKNLGVFYYNTGRKNKAAVEHEKFLHCSNAITNDYRELKKRYLAGKQE